jgi:hypothetical protein
VIFVSLLVVIGVQINCDVAESEFICISDTISVGIFVNGSGDLRVRNDGAPQANEKGLS